MFSAPFGTTYAIDFHRLAARAQQFHADFQFARPWRHVVIDDFIVQGVAAQAAQAFPKVSIAKTALARFLGSRCHHSALHCWKEPIRDVFDALHAPQFVTFLEMVTNIADLGADLDLTGGSGLQQGVRGSYLRVHADRNTHPMQAARFRRLIVMVYLTEDWQPRWNGDLELWDSRANACSKRVLPVFNRCVIMECDDFAYHGYGPLRLRAGTSRKAIVGCYYSDVPGHWQTTTSHETILPRLPGEGRLSALRDRVRRSAIYRIESTFNIS